MHLTDHPAEYKFAVDGGEVFAQLPSGEIVGLAKNPGQLTFVSFEEIAAPYENFKGDEVQSLYQPSKHSRVDLRVLGGWPVVAGTRVPYDVVASLVDFESVTPEEIEDFYPSVSAEAARDMINLERRVEQIKVA
ncbi:DUF433 domain-containing protein [Paramicrobacterium chengjingii]|uniref:DUF433 domain-containing protein n=1 Tax=Paramicrobacterium chengjingii TaxID=2769067 RepID=UPI001F1930DA|nr:DUF433 domain-containing protein [Microbacterium chengjingii]